MELAVLEYHAVPVLALQHLVVPLDSSIAGKLPLGNFQALKIHNVHRDHHPREPLYLFKLTSSCLLKDFPKGGDYFCPPSLPRECSVCLICLI